MAYLLEGITVQSTLADSDVVGRQIVGSTEIFGIVKSNPKKNLEAILADVAWSSDGS